MRTSDRCTNQGGTAIHELTVRVDAAHSVKVLTNSERVVGEVARLNRMFAEQGASNFEQCMNTFLHWLNTARSAVTVGRLPTD